MAYLPGYAASIGTCGNQKGQCLGCTPDAAEFPIRGLLMFAGSP